MLPRELVRELEVEFTIKGKENKLDFEALMRQISPSTVREKFSAGFQLTLDKLRDLIPEITFRGKNSVIEVRRNGVKLTINQNEPSSEKQEKQSMPTSKEEIVRFANDYNLVLGAYLIAIGDVSPTYTIEVHVHADVTSLLNEIKPTILDSTFRANLESAGFASSVGGISIYSKDDQQYYDLLIRYIKDENKFYAYPVMKIVTNSTSVDVDQLFDVLLNKTVKFVNIIQSR